MKTTCILLVSFSLPLAVRPLATSLAYPADAALSRLKVGIVQIPDNPSEPHELRHGHSAIIAPDGRIAAAAQDDMETIVVAELDVTGRHVPRRRPARAIRCFAHFGRRE